MRIRSQLIFSLGLSSAVCIAALAGLITYLHTEDALRRGQDRAQSAAQAAADLLALTQEFAYTGEARAAQQWHLRAAAIDEAIGPEGAHVGEQANVLRKLDTDLADISALFIELEHSGKFGTSATDPAGTRAGVVANDRRQILIDSLLTSTQAVSNNSYLWARQLDDQRKQISQRRLWIFAGITLAFMLVIAQLAYVVLRRVLQPLARLQSVAEAVREGNHDMRVDSAVKNEFGDLARQFDGMTAALTDRNARLTQTAAALATEADLRTMAEKRMRLITDNLPVLVAYVDTESRYRFVNRQYEFLLGLDCERMVGRRVRDVLGEINYARVQPQADEALAGRTTVFQVRLETEYAVRELWASYVPDFDPQGVVQGFFVMHEDITAQKEGAAELKALTERYRLATRAGGVGVWDWNIVTGELTCNPQMHQLYDMPTDTGRPATFKEWSVRIHPDDAPRNAQAFGDAIRGVAPYDTEFRLLLPDGTQRIIKANGAVTHDAHGKAISIVGVNWDISALRHAESTQRATEERLRLLVESVSNYAIVMLDPQGVVESANKAAQQMKGYGAAEILGRNFTLFYTEADRLRNHPAALLAQAAACGRAQDAGWRVRKDGSLFWADVTITALRDEASGALRGFGKVIRDISAQKQKEDAIAQVLSEKDAALASLSRRSMQS